MSSTVLIVSCAQDLHAHAVSEAIERKGGRVRMLYTPDLPARLGLSIFPGEARPALLLHGQERVELGAECTSVWLRRTFDHAPPAGFAASDRRTIERECRAMREGFLELAGPGALWVNPLGRSACSKAAQLAAAVACGLRIPKTLVSNDPAEITAFVRRAAGPVVYKTFNSLVPTTVLTDEMLAEPEILRWTPAIYQHYVEKLHELRVTVIGRRLFAVRINSQETARGRVDWREAQRTSRGSASDLEVCAAELRAEVARRCLDLMKALGLAFGAIDLIVTPAGETVFLEVNEAGQFLWVEEATGLPLVDALSEMLVQGTASFRRRRGGPRVLFEGEVERAAESRLRRAVADGAAGAR